METFNFITVRLGKDSLPEIQKICLSEAGILENPFTINVKCTQVPDNYGVDDYAFLWLGSDNNKGMPTQWKQGFKAVGRVANLTKGKSYNDTSETTIKIVYVFHEAINRMDILRCAPIAYYWCSSMPLIGLDDHANQTIRNMSGSTFADLRAFFSVIEAVTEHFKKDILQIEPRFEQFFDFVIPNPQSYPTAKNIDETGLIKHRSKRIKPLQQIFYGAPGTGKSHRIKEIIQEHGIDEKEQVIRTTFHPDSDYSTFVGCYKPIMKSVPQTYVVEGKEKPVIDIATGKQSEKEEIVYNYTPQAFVQAYTKAWTNQSKPIILVIEEINRGNCAQIFGDIFQLLDRGDDGVSDYEIKPDKALEDYLKSYFAAIKDIEIPEQIKTGEIMKLPANLFIWATMNTSDQSLFPIDSAFKRRWEWKYIPIDTKKEEWHILVNGHKYSWTSFLDIINDKVLTEETAEDKHLGFYFCKAEDKVIGAEKFVGKVLFYLWTDVFKVYGVPPQITNGSKEITYPKFYNPDGSINENMVEKLLDNLQVENDKKNEAEASGEAESNA